MGSPLIILLLVDASARADLPITALAEATRATTGPDTVVLVEQRDELPSDADAVALGQTVRAQAVVELTWRDPEHEHAALRVRLRTSARWAEREIGFKDADSMPERGRTLGFALAAMLWVAAPTSDGPPDASPQQPAPVTRPTPIAPVAASSPRDSVAERTPVRPDEMRRWIAAVDLAATLAPGFGDAGGVGFGLSVRAYVWPSLAVHASGGMRFGNVDAAEASSSVGFGAVGATWRWLELRNPLPIDLGARGDLLAMYLALSRSGTRQSRWIPGARLSAEAAGFLTPNVGIVLAAGGEAMFGTTQVVVGSEATGELAPVHFFTEVGARVRF